MRERSPGRSGHALPKRRATTRGQATLQLYAARYTHQPAPAGRRETLRPPTEANTQRPLSSPEGGCQDRGPIPTEHIKKATEGSGKPAGVHLNFALGLSNEVGPPQKDIRPITLAILAFVFLLATTGMAQLAREQIPIPSREEALEEILRRATDSEYLSN